MLIIALGLAAITIAAVAAGPIVAHARRRALRQPLPCDPDAEATLLAITLQVPATLTRTRAVRPSDFTVAAHQRIWAAIEEARDHSDGTDDDATFAADVRHRLTELADVRVAAQLEAAPADPHQLTRAGKTVLSRAADRDSYGGRLTITPTARPDAPLTRDDPGWGPWRVTATFASLAGWALTALGAATVTGRPLTAAAVLIAGVALTTLALIDVDTLWVDRRTLWTGTGAAWALVAADAYLGNLTGLVIGALAVAAMAIIFEGANAAIRSITGSHGSGSGDTWALLLGAGIPAAAFSTFTITTFSIGLAMLTSAAVGTVARNRTPQDTERFPASAAFLPHMTAAVPAAAGIVATTLGITPM